MTTSRTGTRKWLRLVQQARTRALEHDLTQCPLCRTPLDFTYPGHPNSAEADHIIAHAEGGPDTLENIRIICRLCNQRRGGILGASRRAKNRGVIHPVRPAGKVAW
ncbi:HNH endonuclease [Rothia koreensis]|uniref:HNH endonuclease n=1 Tax=Rothia koreensis TaxID=592378 RepID=UPI003FCD0624